MVRMFDTDPNSEDLNLNLAVPAMPYRLGDRWINRRCRDHQITADTILAFYILF